MTDPRFLHFGAGALAYEEGMVVPEGFVACHVHHQLHRIPKRLYLVCFECGHPWTKRSLRRAYRKIMWEMDGVRGWARGLFRRARDVYSCPECIHDF